MSGVHRRDTVSYQRRTTNCFGRSDMILYHFTSARHLRPISRYGLTVGDVPTDLDRWRGRIGVWLTSSTVPYGHGLGGGTAEKGGYRLSVSVADDAPSCIVGPTGHPKT